MRADRLPASAIKVSFPERYTIEGVSVFTTLAPSVFLLSAHPDTKYDIVGLIDTSLYQLIQTSPVYTWCRPAVSLKLESGSDLARRSDKRPAHDAARR